MSTPRKLALTALFSLALALAAASGTRAQPDRSELLKLLQTIDERQRSAGDSRSQAYIHEHSQGKAAVVYETLVYRRGADQRFMILFIQPKASQGQGYLRVDKNLWFYDPAVGKWERRTERERIGGTNSRRSDFDESRLAEEYEPADQGEEKLGVYETRVLRLTARPGLDLAFPVLKLWIDKHSHNLLKRQDYALSGKLLRTSYYPRWKKLFSAAKGGDVYFPEEIRVYDEVEQGSSTLILLKDVDLQPLEANVFSKAWLESKLR